MTKPEFDELGAAFSAFHHEVGGSVRPATVAEVRSGAQAIRRRRTAAAMIAGVAAAVVLGGSIAYAGQWQGRGAPPAQQQTATVAPSTTASTSPSATPSDTPSASTPTTDLPAAQHLTCPASGQVTSTGPITAADLCNATLQIPSWDLDNGCPHGTVKLTAGRTPTTATGSTPGIDIAMFANVAVSGSAADDAAVVVECHVGDPATVQVVVLSRAASGAIHTVGKVVGPRLGGRGIAVADLRGRTDGTVLVEVYQVLGSDGQAELAAVHQWRGYRFDGSGFTQTSGSTSFDADTTATKLTVAPSAVNFGTGSTHASLKVKVTNTGTTAATDVSLQLLLDDGLEAVPSASCVSTPPQAVRCHTASIAAGATWTATVTINLTSPGVVKANQSNDPFNKVQLRLGDQRYSDTQLTVTVS